MSRDKHAIRTITLLCDSSWGSDISGRNYYCHLPRFYKNMSPDVLALWVHTQKEGISLTSPLTLWKENTQPSSRGSFNTQITPSFAKSSVSGIFRDTWSLSNTSCITRTKTLRRGGHTQNVLCKVELVLCRVPISSIASEVKRSSQRFSKCGPGPPALQSSWLKWRHWGSTQVSISDSEDLN